MGTRAAGTALGAIALLVALLLAWRVVVVGIEAWTEGGSAANRERSQAPRDTAAPDLRWRAELAQNPTNYAALVLLALEFEKQGRVADARAAMSEATRLAPTNLQTLLQAAAFDLRVGDEPQALATLRQAADLYPEVYVKVWPVFVAELDAGRREVYFAGVARDNPEWWPEFFAYACQKAADVDALQRLFVQRVAAGTVSAGERRCLIDRLQHEHRWAHAYQAWLNSLPVAQRQRVGYVFNGRFELPISNLGFDWTTPAQEGVNVDTQPVAGATGRRALRVEFVNQRWGGPPVQQYLMLFPGQYRFEGRGRAEALETWLGVQWGLYCRAENGAERQLARSERFLGTTEWQEWSEDFTVSADCTVQVLRLELANPRRDAVTPGNIAARLRGTVWFDDFRVRNLD